MNDNRKRKSYHEIYNKHHNHFYLAIGDKGYDLDAEGDLSTEKAQCMIYE